MQHLTGLIEALERLRTQRLSWTVNW